jgi:hypothetical protein
MPPRLSTASLDEATLRQTLATYNNVLTTIYLESEARVVLAPLSSYLGPKITLPPVRWLTGRAFGPTLEIRWRMDGEQYESTALTESDAGPMDWQPSSWNARLDAVTRPRDVLLRGINAATLPPEHVLHNSQRDCGIWIDERIPQPLTYPAPDRAARRVVMRGIDYLSWGVVVLTRLSALATYAE